MKLPRSTRFFRRTLRGLPAPRFAVEWSPGVRIPMADDVELVGDHYFPAGGSGSYPTLLVRSPYGRGFPWAALYGVAFAEQGFHVLIQSARGTAGSGGTKRAWRDEGPDGRATAAWLRRQPWFNGRLGLLGPSAMAYAAWALAVDPPPELGAMVVHVPLHDPYGFFYRGGVFALEDALIASVADETQHLGSRRYVGATLRLARGMKRIVRSAEPVEAFSQVMGQRVDVLDGAVAHPEPSDGFWQGTNLLAAADGLAVPTLVVSGWPDVALDQALLEYGRLPEGSRSLLVGRWTHTSALQQGVGKVFGESVAWFQGHLAETAPPKGRVQISVGPDGQWRELPAWPPAAVPVPWYVHADGTLATETPESALASSAASAPTIGAFRHDPADPTPSLGGAGLGRASGIRDNRRLEERSDVLVFTTAPLSEAIDVIGPVAADLLVRTDAPSDATVFVRLCDVDEDGYSRNVCDGIARLPAHATTVSPAPTPLAIAMSSTAHRFHPGHRMRVQISGGAHPRFAADPTPYRVEILPGSAVVLPTL